jgi:D-lactate dehydrogenase (cytochrome)
MTMLREKLSALLGEAHVKIGDDEMDPHVTDWQGRVHRGAAALAMPGSTAEVQAVLRLAAEAGFAVVPLGGNTGLAKGTAASGPRPQVLLSLNRLDRVREIDAANFSLTAEAGCILADVKQAADHAGMRLPIGLGSEGSCRIGGNVSTNAGGTMALRWGMMRRLVMGLEVVLADGTLWNGLSKLRKDNTGYDLKQLFIGAEGTLGVVTAASLTLVPRPTDIVTAMAALEEPEQALSLFRRLVTEFPAALEAAELMPRAGFEIAMRHDSSCREIFRDAWPWSVLIELRGCAAEQLQPRLEELLAHAAEDGLIADAVLAGSLAQANDFWRLREVMVVAQRAEGPVANLDASVPVSAVPAFVAGAEALVARMMPDAKLIAFGHFGDGNIHAHLLPATPGDAGFIETSRPLARAIDALAVELGGSFSAEHGVGAARLAEMAEYKDEVSLDLMRRLKSVFDPGGILNPGKILPPLS